MNGAQAGVVILDTEDRKEALETEARAAQMWPQDTVVAFEVRVLAPPKDDG